MPAKTVTPTATVKTPRVRHAVSRSTGATTWTRKDGDDWRTTCLNHGAETTASARGAAWKNGSTPANFCAKCKAIVAGKADKITGDRLDLSTTPAKKVAAKKPAAKPTAATTAK
ncbi:hypothetical protein [Nocardioides sp. 1609]|uniref:hypothetical protein n=1 Tax=Nocardioides sp. 1609 TaxID=2508327 RepID=UPI00106FD51A|nr:hypothetical protein [Nocardioides sp. 1609]